MKPTKKLILEQVDRKLQIYESLKNMATPRKGWIHTVRSALKMTLLQFGERLNINISSAKDIELREMEGAITLKALREAANALDMQLVYGLTPKDGSLEALIERKARELATKIVMRTAQTMQLEDQANSKERLEKAIEEETEKLMREMPKILWD